MSRETGEVYARGSKSRGEKESLARKRACPLPLVLRRKKQKSEKNGKLSTFRQEKKEKKNSPFSTFFLQPWPLRLSGRFLASALRSSSAASQAQATTTTTATSAVSTAGRRAFSVEGTFGDKERAEEVRMTFSFFRRCPSFRRSTSPLLLQNARLFFLRRPFSNLSLSAKV